MSWIICSSGKKDAVKQELIDAAIEIDHAISALSQTPNEQVAISVSGSTYATDTGEINTQNSYSVTGYAPVVASGGDSAPVPQSTSDEQNAVLVFPAVPLS